MRTWTLEDAVVVEPPMECGERVAVIELEPVLDLLEALFTDSANKLRLEIEVLLRAHGRLDG